MGTIPNFEALEVGKTYFETSSDYYLAKCISINTTVKNHGWNVYFQTATFEITSKHGRKVETTTKKFFID